MQEQEMSMPHAFPNGFMTPHRVMSDFLRNTTAIKLRAQLPQRQRKPKTLLLIPLNYETPFIFKNLYFKNHNMQENKKKIGAV